jgi:hypothetical protein
MIVFCLRLGPWWGAHCKFRLNVLSLVLLSEFLIYLMKHALIQALIQELTFTRT